MSKANGAPKCKLCGVEHWNLKLGEMHPRSAFSRDGLRIGTEPETRVTFGVTREPKYVTKSVIMEAPNAVVTRTVTAGAPESMMIAAAVAPEHECPICGLLHGRPPGVTDVTGIADGVTVRGDKRYASNAERQRAYRGRRK